MFSNIVMSDIGNSISVPVAFATADITVAPTVVLFALVSLSIVSTWVYLTGIDSDLDGLNSK